MAEETVKTTLEEDYIAKIQELKQKSVPLVDYEKVREDNKRLLDAMLNGATSTSTEMKKEEQVDIQGIRNELYGGRYDGTDLDYITKTLKLRKAIMDNGDPDPAVMRGHKVEPSESDYAYAEATCNMLQECVDYANGDPAVFKNEMLRRTSRK